MKYEKGIEMKIAATILALGGAAAVSLAGVNTTVIDFEDGLTHNWTGPQGFGGGTAIDPTGGVGGGAGFRTQFNDFGIDFSNNARDAFTGDYTQYDQVTLSVDLKIDQIGPLEQGITRPFMVELRSFGLGDPGTPWASVYFLFDWVGDNSFNGFSTFSATIDTNATELPIGWGGNGSFDPDTFEPALPRGVTVADILANVDEVAFSTFLPGYFFTADQYDMTLDNITISTFTVPAPSTLALIGFSGLVGTRRRR